MNEKVISAGVVLHLIQYAKQRKIDLEQFDITSVLNREDVNHRVAFTQYAKLAEYVLQKTKDDRLGIHVGKQYNLSALGIVGQLIQAAQDIKEALTKVCATYNLVSNVMSVSLEEGEDSFSLTFSVDDETFAAYPEVMNHFIMTSMVFAHREMTYLTLKEESPVMVGFRSWKGDSNELAALFDSKIILNEEKDHIQYRAELLDEKILWADYQLYLHLEKVANEKLANLSKAEPGLSSSVREIILDMLDPNIPTIDEVADQVNLSVRDMQRKLKYEKTSYQEIKANIQKELAIDYLTRGLSIKETCYLMGYSESSAFISAFHRWYGVTPTRYKKEYLMKP